MTRPEPAPFPRCLLPAVDAWAVYDYAEGGPRYVESFPYCRFHEQTQAVAAKRAAAAVSPAANIYPMNYEKGQSRIACTGDRNPEQLGAVLDRERIEHAADGVREALRRLTYLTANAYGHSFRIGNEAAVIEALQELAEDVADAVRVVESRQEYRR